MLRNRLHAWRNGNATAPPVPVTVAAVVHKPTPVTITAIGTVQPVLSVTVRSQVDGTMERVNFVEDQDVNAGDLLFVLDRRPRGRSAQGRGCARVARAADR